MTLVEMVGVVGGFVMAAVVLSLARLGLSGGELAGPRPCTFVCPRFRERVDCTIVQDVRTGQWREVLSCSAFGAPGKLLCDQDCRRVLNLGISLDGPVPPQRKEAGA